MSRIFVYTGYLRGLLLRLRGAKVGPRTRIDRFFCIENATGLTTGARTHIEPNVAIKIVRPDAIVQLGEQVFVGRNSTLDVSERLWVGDRTLIAPGCFITDHDHVTTGRAPISGQGIRSNPVRVGSDAWIGANACILAGVTVGEGAVIGAGAVVTSDIPPFSIAVGVPAKVIGHRT